MGVAVIPSKVNSASSDTWPRKFLVSLLVTLFGSVQWEFRYPFDPIFTAFTVHASHCLLTSLRKSRMALLSERISTLLRRLYAGLRRFKLAR